jgi:hypothetical protein
MQFFLLNNLTVSFVTFLTICRASSLAFPTPYRTVILIDVGSGDLGKNKKKKDKELGEAHSVQSATNFETVFEGIFNKFQKLSYYDQHVVTHQCVICLFIQHLCLICTPVHS